jgi:hypothetical protein
MLNAIMAKSTNIVKRKAGRPVEIGAGADKFMGVRLPADLMKRVDAWAARNERTRSVAVRDLLEKGLKKP